MHSCRVGRGRRGVHAICRFLPQQGPQCCRASSIYAAPAPAPGNNFNAAPAPAAPAQAPAPTLLYSKAKFLKRTKVYTHIETIFFI
jgi:hypothetical protein